MSVYSDQSKEYLKQLLQLFRRNVLKGSASGPDSINVTTTASALPTGAATAANQTTEITSLQIMDDWDESDRAKVNTIVGQAGVAANIGTVSATTQRVTLATDVALPAGEFHLGATGGNTSKIAFAPTTSATAYTANDNIGEIITLTNLLRTSGGSGLLDTISIWLLNNAAPNLYIDFWDATPSGTYTNDSAQVIAGDQLKWLGMVEVAVSDWKQTGVISRCTVNPPKFGVKGNASANIFMTIQDKTGVTLGSTAGMFGYVTCLQD